MQRLTKPFILVLAVWYATILSGCHKPQKEIVREPAVTVTQPVEQEVTRYLEYTGTTQALEYVDIRARVAGFLEKIHFEDDQKVKAGDLLFTIDPRQYVAAVHENEGALESRKAQFRLAKTEEEIAKSLESQQAISALKLQEKVANSSVSKANIDIAQADLETAQLNLEWTKVISPINGRVSRHLVDIGNLVGATEKTLLTTVVADESVYFYFNVNELDLLSLKKTYSHNGSNETIKSRKIPAYLELADGSRYPLEGYIDYADTKLNPSTGTIQVRAIFPNPDRFLLAGMFGRVRVPLEKRKAFVVPGVAVQFGQGGNYLLVVNDENVVQQKRVKLGQNVGEMTVIEEGVAPKDRVITMGVQRARPGSKVNPSVAATASPQPGAGAEKKTQEK
jgi:membrane fusion protein, multidrug efflux system